MATLGVDAPIRVGRWGVTGQLDLSKPIVVPVGPEPRVEADVPFREIDEGSLLLDVYHPTTPQGDGDCPAVVMAYGDTDPEQLRGARRWGQYRSWGTLLANEGFVAVVPDHRSYRVAGLRAAAEDVGAALEFVSEHGSRFGIDTDRTAVFGVSFGVVYQLWALRYSRADVRALVCYYGFMNLRGLEDELQEDTDAVAQFSAMDHLEAGQTFPPMLIAQAEKDFEGLNATIDSFVRVSALHGQELELVCVAEAGHAFDVLDETDASRDAIWRTLKFLRAHLG